MLTPAYFQFLNDLSQNNQRDWFLVNKKRYETVCKEPFLVLVDEVIHLLQQSSEPDLILDAKQTLFRINRDVRFSKDKRPYKEHLSAVFAKGGTKDKQAPGHYLEVGLERVFIAGGAYFFEQKETLYRVREYIAQNLETFKSLIENPNFKSLFGEIQGEKNKRLTPEFREAASQQPLIFNTQFYWAATIDTELALNKDFAHTIVKYCQAAKPLNDFLKAAMY